MRTDERAAVGADAFEVCDPEQSVDSVEYHFSLSRRAFTQVLGAGLLLAIHPPAVLGQTRQQGGRGRSGPIAARLLIGEDGTVTVLTGKIEMGQGARAELAQAAAEELRLPVGAVQMVMGDTGRVPDDGLTAGSRTTPQTLPSVRQGAAAARELLVDLAAQRWGVDRSTLEAANGKVRHGPSQRSVSYAELAQSAEGKAGFQQRVADNVTVTPVGEWKVLGVSVPRPNQREIVTGAHRYPSDYRRPGMLYGKILRAPAYGARLMEVDVGVARALPDVVVVRDGEFVGVAAATSYAAQEALEAIAKTARWETPAHPSSRELFTYLREQAREGIPSNPFTDEVKGAHRSVRQAYQVAYVQHAPMETRTALAEWHDGQLTVWTGTQNPFGYHQELARAFRLSNAQVRVIVPDFGGGFGGKHTGEVAVEAARLAQAAKRPVLVHWTRGEEFTWAYFRPAALIEAEATLDAGGKLTSWHFINVNAGGAAIETPYRAGKAQSRSVASRAPLRQGSYRALAANANNFARESFMDELAAASGVDPLAFRLAHLEQGRLRSVLEEAAQRFNWAERVRRKEDGIGVGLACGTEKGSYVATCVEVAIENGGSAYAVRRVCAVFECGAIINPSNLLAQVQGCILMALGPALREEMQFEGGTMRNATFGRYLVPRLADVPELDIHLLNRSDLTSVGAGETPMIALAPAIANAICHATGRRVRQMPIRLDAAGAV